MVVGTSGTKQRLGEDYRESVNAVLNEALKGNETSNYQLPIVTKDELKLDVLLNAMTKKTTLYIYTVYTYTSVF